MSLILTPIGAIAAAVYYFIVKYYSGAIIFLIFAGVFVFVYMGYRRRIPLAAKFLEVVIDISKHHKLGVWGTTLIAILLQAGLSVWYVFTVIATYIRWGTGACTAGMSCRFTLVLLF